MLVLKLLLAKWITPASTRMWTLVAGAFGVLVLVVKLLLTRTRVLRMENKALDSEVKRAERIQDVEISTTRDFSIDRLRKHKSIRPD